MKEKIIQISHGRYTWQFKIELLEPKRFLGIFPYLKSVMLSNGLKWRDVMDYKMAWQKEYSVKEENIFDLTK